MQKIRQLKEEVMHSAVLEPLWDVTVEDRLLAQHLVSRIEKSDGRISLTLTDKGAIVFAQALIENASANQAPKEEKICPHEDLISKKEVMTLLQVSDTTLYLWNKNGYLPHVKIGRKVMYKRDKVNGLLEATSKTYAI